MPDIYVSDIYTMEDVCRDVLSRVFGNDPGFYGKIYYMTDGTIYYTVVISFNQFILSRGYYPDIDSRVLLDCYDRFRFYCEIKRLIL